MCLKLQLLLLKILVHKQIHSATLTKKVGSDYGGFSIAVGNIPEKCNILSFGIGEDISFDLAMIQEYHANVFGFDPTPKSITWVENNVKTERFHFYPVGISDKDENAVFYLPNNTSHVSGSVVKHDSANHRKINVAMKCIDSIMKMIGHSKVSVIKMDIEGSEFKVIPAILDSALDFHQLCVEIHWRFLSDGYLKLLQLIRQMNKSNYYIADFSSNFEDFTFVKGHKKHRTE